MQSFVEQITHDLSNKGWSSLDGFFASDLCEQLRYLIQNQFDRGQLKKAGIGRGDSYRIDSEMRADYIRWLDDFSHPSVDKAKEKIEDFRTQINQSLFLGLNGFEGHLTCYPVGKGYIKHLDVFQDKSSRVLSFVLYLNQDWRPENGGELLIYDRNDPDAPPEKVPPVEGRLVTFISNEIPHAVAPNQAPRFSLTGWYLRS